MSKENYYISSFFWSTLTKVVNALVGFISVPLLIGIYGKGNYGVLALATSCNAYMHILDLGINTGAVRFFSQWRTEGKHDMIGKVAHTNITFYGIIAIINALVMIAIAIWGRGLFNISAEQFGILRACLVTIAVFSIFSWLATAFNQLLVSDKQMAFTQKAQFVQVVFKAVLIAVVLLVKMPLTWYFFFLTAIIAGLIIPYAARCLRCGLIDNLKPGFYWKEFKVVLLFSLSLFALSIFQMTATESRAIILGIFCTDAADVAADFKVISVIPSLIITIGMTFSTIFLPGSSELAVRQDQQEIEQFSYRWTRLTSIVANVLCLPFILCAREVLTAYVGESFSGLWIWLVLWCITCLIQIHTTPGNSLVLAYGKTKPLVITTAIACVVSIVINILLCHRFGAGSAIIGYLVYVIIVIGLYYFVYYDKLLHLDRWRMAKCFLAPTLVAFAVGALVTLVPVGADLFKGMHYRLANILICLIKTALWGIPYVGVLLLTGILRKGEIKQLFKR